MSWADTHIIVMGMDTDTNDKIKQAIKQQLEGETEEWATSHHWKILRLESLNTGAARGVMGTSILINTIGI